MFASSYVRIFGCLVGVLFVSASTCGAVWDVSYDGSVLPNDPTLGANAWQLHDYYAPNDLSKTTAADGMLHVVDEWSDRAVTFSREGDYLPTGSSVTVEARVKVLSGSNELSFLSPVFFGVQVGQGANAQVYLWPDRVGTRYSGNNAFTVVTLDMTQYHTIRLAMGPQATFSVWVDEALLFTGTPLPGRRGSAVYFTSGLLEQAISDSYWD